MHFDCGNVNSLRTIIKCHKDDTLSQAVETKSVTKLRNEHDFESIGFQECVFGAYSEAMVWRSRDLNEEFSILVSLRVKPSILECEEARCLMSLARNEPPV